LRSLQDKFEELENLLLHYRRTLAQHVGVPFVRLVYSPEEEVECQRLRERLARTLERDSVSVETVSCRGAIFAHYEHRGRLDQLFELEREKKQGLGVNIAKHARQELVGRLLAAAERLNGDGVIFLADVAFIYPYIHQAPVLEECTNRIKPPLALVIFYPCEVDVDSQLLFLGARPSGYYRTRDLI